nr:D-alanyl-D-alanine carboxypeptidase/D-alanyl-D-alanine-endopeptidase [uncultured Porphyromonas sp.]
MVLRNIFFLLLAALPLEQLVAQGVAPNPLALARVDSLIRASEESGVARYSFAVQDVSQDTLWAAYRPEEMCTPASITKLFTAATALESLGADYSFCTELYMEGELKSGVLYGNLLVIGSGDPSIDSKFFEQDKERWQQSVLQTVQAKGIRRIEGNIVIDASRFERMGIHPRWAPDDRGDYYAAGVYGFNLYDNWLDLYFATGGVKDSIRLVGTYPKGVQLTLDNRLKVNCKTQGWEGDGTNLVEHRTLLGTLPCNRESVRVAIDLPHPPLHAARLLRATLEGQGVEILGQEEARFESSSHPRTLIGRYYSPSLRDLCREMNYRSLNHYAEALFKALVKENGATSEQAWLREQEILSSWGVRLSPKAHLYDGSGLTRANRLSAQDMVALLVGVSTKARGNTLDAFAQSLPRVGREGTVKGFMPGTSLKLYCKSGSMRGVQTYAGYLYYQRRVYAVALLANGCANRAKVRGVMQQYIEGLFPPKF